MVMLHFCISDNNIICVYKFCDQRGSAVVNAIGSKSPQDQILRKLFHSKLYSMTIPHYTTSGLHNTCSTYHIITESVGNGIMINGVHSSLLQLCMHTRKREGG